MPTNENETENENENEQIDIDGIDVYVPLEPFDTTEMRSRYQAAMIDLNEREGALLQEFDALCKDMQSWSKARIIGDTQHASKRLKTSVASIAQQEREVEMRRQSVVACIEAVKRAVETLIS